MSEHKLLQYEIVDKIVIRDNAVYFYVADNDIRPLQFIYREEPVLTTVFQQEDLHGLLVMVARDIYHGRIRLRAGSRVTRAIRTSLHELTVEQFQAMDEELAVQRLAALAEKSLLDAKRDRNSDIPTSGQNA